jgi:hypothetical protein
MAAAFPSNSSEGCGVSCHQSPEDKNSLVFNIAHKKISAEQAQ